VPFGALVQAILALVGVIVGPLTASTPATRAPVPLLAAAQRLGDGGGAGQLIVVRSAVAPDTVGELQAFDRAGDHWQPLGPPVPARLGLAGTSANHREGDGTTPSGLYTVHEAFGVDADPGTKLAYRRAGVDDWWVSDPTSALYNTWQHGDPAGRWDPSDGEALWRAPTSYAYALVVDYNRAPVVAGAGSAIFLHVDNGNPTHGCVAVGRDEMVALLRWADPARQPMIAIVVG
jgi:L,D-peptidoglycan transpeptidase YkuD (ErfK/YbiS/YcfS/YnhG family)